MPGPFKLMIKAHVLEPNIGFVVNRTVLMTLIMKCSLLDTVSIRITTHTGSSRTLGPPIGEMMVISGWPETAPTFAVSPAKVIPSPVVLM